MGHNYSSRNTYNPPEDCLTKFNLEVLINLTSVTRTSSSELSMRLDADRKHAEMLGICLCATCTSTSDIVKSIM